MSRLASAPAPAALVAYQGEPGAFSEEAALAFFAGEAPHALLPCASFADVVAAVEAGRAHYGVLPVENTLAGRVIAVYALLARAPLAIVCEATHAIRQALIAAPGATLGGLRRVFSHPVALAQCRRFFTEHFRIEAVAADDTAGAVAAVVRAGETTVGAIASRRCAALYGGIVLAEGIEDEPGSFTRFVLLVRDPG